MGCIAVTKAFRVPNFSSTQAVLQLAFGFFELKSRRPDPEKPVPEADVRPHPTERLKHLRTSKFHQIGPDFVLGRYRKELDVEFIRLYVLKAEIVNRAYLTPAMARTYAAPAPRVGPEEILSPLRAYLRNAAGQQEVFYSKNSSHADDVRKLGTTEDKNIIVHVLSASDRGWAMIAVPRNADVICAMAMGAVPLGWAPGQAHLWRGDGRAVERPRKHDRVSSIQAKDGAAIRGATQSNCQLHYSPALLTGKFGAAS
jgi:hypothetical protein